MTRTVSAAFVSAALVLCVPGSGSLLGTAAAPSEVNAVPAAPSNQVLVIAGGALGPSNRARPPI